MIHPGQLKKRTNVDVDKKIVNDVQRINTIVKEFENNNIIDALIKKLTYHLTLNHITLSDDIKKFDTHEYEMRQVKNQRYHIEYFKNPDYTLKKNANER